MKKRGTAKNRTTAPAEDHGNPSDMSINGARHFIAMKAYELYEQRGRADGHALEDWLKAEAIVNGETE